MRELEDLSWFPAALRDFQTGSIGFLVTRFRVYDAFVVYLRTLSLTRQPMWDLCSGSGEAAISIFKGSGRFTALTLSDKFPNKAALRDGRSTHVPRPVDVLDMRFERGTCYTMFNALHHFSDAEKLGIAQRIQESGATAFFVEVLEPRASCLLKVLFVTVAGTLLLTPFVRPFSFWRLFFTYILPVNLFTIPFDGIVSVLRSRSAQHYQALFTSAHPAIQVHRLKNGRSPLIVIRIHSNP